MKGASFAKAACGNIHYNMTCAKSGMSPIIGNRYRKKDTEEDLCEDEFNKLSAEDKSFYERFATAKGGAEQLDYFSYSKEEKESKKKRKRAAAKEADEELRGRKFKDAEKRAQAEKSYSLRQKEAAAAREQAIQEEKCKRDEINAQWERVHDKETKSRKKENEGEQMMLGEEEPEAEAEEGVVLSGNEETKETADEEEEDEEDEVPLTEVEYEAFEDGMERCKREHEEEVQRFEGEFRKLAAMWKQCMKLRHEAEAASEEAREKKDKHAAVAADKNVGELMRQTNLRHN